MSRIRMQSYISFKDGFEEFLEYKISQGCAQATIKHYIESIHVFTLFFDEENPVTDIAEKTPALFFSNLRERDLADETIATYMRALRTVLYFLMDRGYLRKFKVEVPKATKSFKQIYTDDELKKLLRKPDMNKCSFVEYRDWVIINYILGTGQRVSTIINIRIRDLNLEDKIIFLRHLKNRSQTVLPVSDTLISILRRYLTVRGGSDDDCLFPTYNGNPMSASALISSIRRYNRSRGVEKTSIHLLRHTFAVKWVKESGDIAKLQRILTHSSLETTQLYLDFVCEDLRDSVNTVTPLETLKRSDKIAVRR